MPQELDAVDRQFSALCAAYDRQYTNERREPFRSAFRLLTASQVARMVERLLDGHGPERMPTIHECWQAHRSIEAARNRDDPGTPQEINLPAWQREANRLLIHCATSHPGKDSRAGYRLAKRIAEQFEALANDRDPDATLGRMATALLDQYQKLPQGQPHV